MQIRLLFQYLAEWRAILAAKSKGSASSIVGAFCSICNCFEVLKIIVNYQLYIIN